MNLKALYQKSIVLPPIIIFTYFCLFWECATYHGFFGKHLFISTSVMLIAVVVTSFYFLLIKGCRVEKELALLFKINTYLYIFLLIIYLSFQILDVNFYSNYVFSKFHLIPSNFIYPLILGTYLIVLEKLISFNKKINRSLIINYIGYIGVVIGLFVFSLSYGSINLGNIIRDNIFITKNLNLSRDQKFEKDLGYIFYDLSKLINEKTEKNSRILIAPQVEPYGQTGNVGYFRYFIYPRYPVNGSLGKNVFDGIDYVLIIRGEKDITESDKYFWPNEPIKAEKIYALQENGGIKEYNENYDPEKFIGIGGIIKLKK